MGLALPKGVITSTIQGSQDTLVPVGYEEPKTGTGRGIKLTNIISGPDKD